MSVEQILKFLGGIAFILVAYLLYEQDARIETLEERFDWHTPSYTDLKEYHAGRATIRKNVFIGAFLYEENTGKVLKQGDMIRVFETKEEYLDALKRGIVTPMSSPTGEGEEETTYIGPPELIDSHWETKRVWKGKQIKR